MCCWQIATIRLVFFTDEEIARLLASLRTAIATARQVGNDWLIPYVILVGWIGARRGELLSLERRQLDLDAGKITLDLGTTKNGEGRVIYLPDAAWAALRTWDGAARELERKRGSVVRNVFHRHGLPIREFPYDLGHAACDAAHFPERRLPHDFRRTAARSYRRGATTSRTRTICARPRAGWRSETAT